MLTVQMWSDESIELYRITVAGDAFIAVEAWRQILTRTRRLGYACWMSARQLHLDWSRSL